jgi:mRNA-degrading endonuclease RelE of RelBE toxin-antitoxin system
MARGAYRVEILPAALKALAAIPDPWQDRLRVAIRELAHDPEPADSIPMTGRAEGMRRRRVGTYRIVYRVKAGRLVVLVVRVGLRSMIYRGLEPRSSQRPPQQRGSR